MPNKNVIVSKNCLGLDSVVDGSIPVIQFPWNRTHYRLLAYLSLLSKSLKFRGGNTQWAYFKPARISRSSSAHDRSGVALCGVRSRNGTRLDILHMSLQGGFLMFLRSYGLIDRSNKAKTMHLRGRMRRRGDEEERVLNYLINVLSKSVASPPNRADGPKSPVFRHFASAFLARFPIEPLTSKFAPDQFFMQIMNPSSDFAQMY